MYICKFSGKYSLNPNEKKSKNKKSKENEAKKNYENEGIKKIMNEKSITFFECFFFLSKLLLVVFIRIFIDLKRE